ncbi:hypothetical protein EFY79_09955 [Hanamia caeni]|jgi:hypothetical protein|uniref:Uncharacterized protein n=1 Tax=Hanamia caeni TaxID=2294116 RepID=A0A3M9NFS2_9BACT|nr:hypothetical protein [Hanamia caeni]RNI36642.1 hypothetical protein EFY79_09955 [Hanamia caeni]
MKRLFTFIFLVSVAIAFSCKKTVHNISNSLAEKYFEKYVIGNDFVVTLAKDSTADFTADYKNYKFILLETDLLHGPLKAVSGTQTYMGSWQTNDDYSKLDISLPDSIVAFKFLSRSWRFTKKANPTLELAPWGSTAPIVLHMTRK